MTASRPPAATPPPRPRHGRRLWTAVGLWSLFGLLLVASALALIPACGLNLFGGRIGFDFCPAAAASDGAEDPSLALLVEERDQGAALDERLRRLQLDLARAPDCPIPAAPEPEVEVAAVEPEAPFAPPEPVRRPTAPDRPPPPPPPPVEPAPPRVAEPIPAPAPPPPASDPEMDRRLDREGVADQNVMITLVWDNVNDIDLHVVCPNGRRIAWDNMAACGGRLDVDANGGGPQTASPVENISWPGRLPSGAYRVEVHHFANHGGRDPTPYRVRVRIDGRDLVFTGVLNRDQRRSVHRFTIP